MKNEDKVHKYCVGKFKKDGFTTRETVEKAMVFMGKWKDKQFKEQLNSLKDEIQSNLCASSGFNDEYSHGYQDCGMKVMETIDKIFEL